MVLKNSQIYFLAFIPADERFKEQRNLNYISKWLRNSIKQHDNFEESMQGLRNFFEEVGFYINFFNFFLPEPSMNCGIALLNMFAEKFEPKRRAK